MPVTVRMTLSIDKETDQVVIRLIPDEEIIVIGNHGEPHVIPAGGSYEAETQHRIMLVDKAERPSWEKGEK